MKLLLVGCSHRSSSVDIRERLAFTPAQTVEALRHAAHRLSRSRKSSCCRPATGSNCTRPRPRRPAAPRLNSSSASWPTSTAWMTGMCRATCFSTPTWKPCGTCSRWPPVWTAWCIGEAQILSQVKQAFAAAQDEQTTGPVTHLAFEAANRVAKRVATETDINRRRVSIPSVAVADFARQFFETFDDKNVLLLGAGEMGEETLRYLREEGAQQIVILNRSTVQRAENLAARLGANGGYLGTARGPAGLGRSGRQHDQRSRSDCHGRTVPEPFSNSGPNARCSFSIWPCRGISIPPSRNFSNVYLFCIDDLQQTCERNRTAREAAWPNAVRIVEEETDHFRRRCEPPHHRANHPTTQATSRRAQERRTTPAVEQVGGNRRPRTGRNRAIVREARQQTAASTAGIPARRSEPGITSPLARRAAPSLPDPRLMRDRRIELTAARSAHSQSLFFAFFEVVVRLFLVVQLLVVLVPFLVVIPTFVEIFLVVLDLFPLLVLQVVVVSISASSSSTSSSNSSSSSSSSSSLRRRRLLRTLSSSNSSSS